MISAILGLWAQNSQGYQVSWTSVVQVPLRFLGILAYQPKILRDNWDPGPPGPGIPVGEVRDLRPKSIEPRRGPIMNYVLDSFFPLVRH